MPLLYGRKIIVKVAGLTITEPRINFDIQRKASSTPDTCTVLIYNLSKQNEQRIRDKSDQISIEAGYQNRTGVIFNGPVARVTRERRQLARITKIWLGVGGASPTGIRGTFNMSYQRITSVRDIVKDIAASFTPPLELGPLDAIPADLQKVTWNRTSSSALALDALLDGFDIDWYVDNGVLRFNEVGEGQPDKSRIRISPKNGLIGSPTITEEGVRIRTFLNPLLELGGTITLESEVVSGQFKIAELNFRGDNWDGQFISDMDLRATGGGVQDRTPVEEQLGEGFLRT